MSEALPAFAWQCTYADGSEETLFADPRLMNLHPDFDDIPWQVVPLIKQADALSATVELVAVLEMVKDALYVEEPLGYYRLRESFDEQQIDAAIAKFKGA